jgi:predicted RNA-binding protein Jag
MPIVSHNLVQSEQANGSTHNVLRMYDQDAREYLQTWFAPAGFDAEAKVNMTIAEMDVQLAESEFEALIGSD